MNIFYLDGSFVCEALSEEEKYKWMLMIHFVKTRTGHEDLPSRDEHQFSFYDWFDVTRECDRVNFYSDWLIQKQFFIGKHYQSVHIKFCP